jgi:membrane-bound metal-dependent hydrolase YbcI (DUF457 family)
MNASMPSPIGHVLAGIAVALAGDRRPVADGVWRFLFRPLTLCCVALATLPDADLLFRGFHRTATHSVGATILVIIVAIAVTGWVTPVRSGPISESQPRRHENTKKKNLFGRGVVWVLVAAHASHLLTDWLGTDLSNPAGIQALWPFSGHWFISGWRLFPQIERRDMFSLTSIAINLRALVWEVVLLGPIVVVLWRLRRRPVKPSQRYS